jgi:hypothetical protein
VRQNIILEVGKPLSEHSIFIPFIYARDWQENQLAGENSISFNISLNTSAVACPDSRFLELSSELGIQCGRDFQAVVSSIYEF